MIFARFLGWKRTRTRVRQDPGTGTWSNYYKFLELAPPRDARGSSTAHIHVELIYFISCELFRDSVVLEGSKAPYVTVSQEYFQNFQRLVVLRAGERVLFVTSVANFGMGILDRSIVVVWRVCCYVLWL